MNNPQPNIPNFSDLQDKVPESMHPVLEWMSKHRKLLVALISVVILVVAGYSGWQVWTAHHHDSAQTELGEILMAPDTDAERIAKLQAFVAKAPHRAALRGRVELAAYLLAAEEYEQAAAVFAELAKNEDPDIRALAGIGQARALLLDGKPAEAADLLNAIKPTLPEAYAAPVTHLLATAAEAAGKTDMAVSAYQELLSSAPGADAEYILYKLNQLTGDQAPSGS